MPSWCPFLLFQSSSEGPKRIPVSQQSEMAVVTPAPHQRVLGVSNGPQRIQRPVSHHKSLTHVCDAVKSTQYTNQNVDPQSQKKSSALQPKQISQQIPPKTNVPKVSQEAAKRPEPEKLQSKSVSNSTNDQSLFYCWANVTMFFSALVRQTCQKWLWKGFCNKVCLLFSVFSMSSFHCYSLLSYNCVVLPTQNALEPWKLWHWPSPGKG